MIDYLRGTVAFIDSEYIVLDVRGVGYRVFCANPYAFQREGEKETTVYIHHHVREDAILLYGFSTREQQLLFRRLLEVAGIGPKVALGMLSGAAPEAIVKAVQAEDIAFLSSLPGIGKKTAQRIIFDLKDKLSNVAGFHEAPAMAAAASSAAAPPMLTAWNEAKEALVSLGYSESEISRIRNEVCAGSSESDGVEVLVKKALQLLLKS